MKTGYRWFIKLSCELYEPQEQTYPTLDKVKSAMIDYLADSNIPLSACGIDFVEDDDGCIWVAERVVDPTETYYEN